MKGSQKSTPVLRTLAHTRGSCYADPPETSTSMATARKSRGGNKFLAGLEVGRRAVLAGCIPPSCVAIALFLSAGCATERRAEDEQRALDEPHEELVIRFDRPRQRITGFGASSAWTAPNMPDAMADRFFSEEHGLGLSLLRIQVKPEGTSFEMETARLAAARGAKIWAAPWSPPADWKTNGQTMHGGSLLDERYDDWAASLADFAEQMTAAGLPLLALSAQNEPDYSAEWDTCLWTPEQLASFVGDYLGPAIRERGLDTPVLAPESANWGSFERYANAILEHDEARDFVGAVATHSYGGTAFSYEEPGEHGKEIWQTEVSDPGSAEDPEMDSALRTARMIHEHLTIANVNAWHYWWLVPNIYPDAPETTGGLVNQDYALTRRAYALGQFSKFVRPGFRRVDTTDTRRSGTFASAYVDGDSDRVTIVVVNEKRESVERTLELRGGRLGELATWLTSEDAALEESEPVRAEGNRLTLELEPRSIVTLVGQLVPERDAG